MMEKLLPNSKNSSWEQQLTQVRHLETISLVIIAAFFVVGLLFDLFNVVIIYTENLSNIALSSVEIQASVSALAISLVAVISNSINDEYAGVSVSNYYLNIRPTFFAQKRIIIGTIILVGISILAQLLGWYNFAISCVWISCILIIISVIELYSAFNGKRNTIDEIENYVDYIMAYDKVPYSQKIEVFCNYSSYLSNTLQDNLEYEKNKNRYITYVYSLLEIDDARSISIISSTSENLVKKLITTSEVGYRIRSIEMLDEIYGCIWKYISNNGNKHILEEFNLYENCSWEIIPEMENIPSKNIERNVSWRHLADYIMRVNIYCHKNDVSDVASLDKSLDYIKRIPSYMGYLLTVKRKKRRI